jgi:hypothetical protein
MWQKSHILCPLHLLRQHTYVHRRLSAYIPGPKDQHGEGLHRMRVPKGDEAALQRTGERFSALHAGYGILTGTCSVAAGAAPGTLTNTPVTPSLEIHYRKILIFFILFHL